ncbi:hypothetical protein AMTR_s00066p00162640 [Amborella trichopoda]|uniref:Uncharacterized protein n=1 Tax=Amborella trichopoda TaxID=13333 RepID=U5DI56_AMBTC|nr:hypothetical protein AMTR_s00066p00162640 [Amborella trichopoda]
MSGVKHTLTPIPRASRASSSQLPAVPAPCLTPRPRVLVLCLAPRPRSRPTSHAHPHVATSRDSRPVRMLHRQVGQVERSSYLGLVASTTWGKTESCAPDLRPPNMGIMAHRPPKGGFEFEWSARPFKCPLNPQPTFCKGTCTCLATSAWLVLCKVHLTKTPHRALCLCAPSRIHGPAQPHAHGSPRPMVHLTMFTRSSPLVEPTTSLHKCLPT